MNFEASDRIKFASAVLAAAILSSGLTLGLYKVGGGLAARAGNAITVTGTASENATADNAVWTLNLNESQKTLASSVSTIDSSASALKKYLITGVITEDQIELGPINSNAIMEYVNGNQLCSPMKLKFFVTHLNLVSRLHYLQWRSQTRFR